MKHMSIKSGAPPGTLMYLGRETKEDVRISFIEYNEKEFLKKILRISMNVYPTLKRVW